MFLDRRYFPESKYTKQQSEFINPPPLPPVFLIRTDNFAYLNVQ